MKFIREFIVNIRELVTDWGGFERLVVALHETGDVSVEHNVVIQGRSGAPRQIDVLLRHKQGLYEHLVVVECKYWNTPVERIHVDALSTTVKEVGASKGVIFSAKGFQSGAVTQAAHDGIDLYTVRDLTDEEWGLPGKVVEIYLHVNSVSLGPPKVEGAFAIQPLGPGGAKLDLRLGDPERNSKTPAVIDGNTDKTLEEAIESVAFKAAKQVYIQRPIQMDGGYDGEVRLRTKVNFEPSSPMTLSIPSGTIYVPKISFDIGLTISQSKIVVDRSSPYIFALAVEDCVRERVVSASRRENEVSTRLTEIHTEGGSHPHDEYKNGSLISVWVKGFQKFDPFESMEYGVPAVGKEEK